MSKHQTQVFEDTNIQTLYDKLLSTNLIPRDIQFLCSSTISIKSQEGEIVKATEIKAANRLKYSDKDNYKTIVNYVHNLIKDEDFDTKLVFLALLETIPFKYEVNHTMRAIANLEQVIQKNNEPMEPLRNKKFRSKLGQYSLVQFWVKVYTQQQTSWSGVCRKNIQTNLEILQTYPSIQYITISMDDRQDDHQEGLKYIWSQKIKPQNIIHYRFQDGWDPLNAHIRGLEIEVMPFVLVIDKEQKILYIGRGKELKTVLNELMKDEGINLYMLVAQQKEFLDQDQETLQQQKSMILEQNEQSPINQSSIIKVEPYQHQHPIEVKSNQTSKIQQASQINGNNLMKKKDDSDTDEEDWDNEYKNLGKEKVSPKEILDDLPFNIIKEIFKTLLPTKINSNIKVKGLTLKLREVYLISFSGDIQDQQPLEKSKLQIINELPENETKNMENFKKELQEMLKVNELDIAENLSEYIDIQDKYINNQTLISATLIKIFKDVTGLDDIFQNAEITEIYFDQDQNYYTKYYNELVAISKPKISHIIECKKQFYKFLENFKRSNENNEEDYDFGKREFKRMQQVLYLKPGDKYEIINEYILDQEKTEIKHSPNQRTIIYYFNTELTGQLKDMIMKNDNIEQTLQYKIHAINLDSISDQSEENFSNKDTLVYSLYDEENNPYQFDYIAYGDIQCPYYIVVDQEGTILKNRRIISDNDYIELFSGQTSLVTKKKKDIVSPELNLDDMAKKLVSKCKDFGNSSQFKIQVYQKKYVSEIKSLFSYTIAYKIRDYLQKELEELIKTTFEDKIQIQEEDCNIIKTLSIIKPVQDSKCKQTECLNKISYKEPQYYSLSTEEYYCVQCAEKPDESYECPFKIKDQLIYINFPLTSYDVLSHIDQINRRYPGRCNYCTKRIRDSVVYQLIPECRVNFCQNCFKDLKNRNSDAYQPMIQNWQSYGMTEDFLLVREKF